MTQSNLVKEKKSSFYDPVDVLQLCVCHGIWIFIHRHLEQILQIFQLNRVKYFIREPSQNVCILLFRQFFIYHNTIPEMN